MITDASAVNFTGAGGTYSTPLADAVNFTGATSVEPAPFCVMSGLYRPVGSMSAKLTSVKDVRHVVSDHKYGAAGSLVVSVSVAGEMSGKYVPHPVFSIPYPFVNDSGIIAQRERVTGRPAVSTGGAL